MSLLRIALLAVLAVTLAGPAARADSGIEWEHDLTAAQQRAAQTNRLVLLHIGATWCPPCQRLERNVFSRPGFGRELTASYVAVKLDYDQNTALVQRLGVQSIPTDIIMRPNGEVVEKLQSPPSPERYVAAMTEIAAGHRPVAVPIATSPPTIAASNPAPQPGPPAVQTALPQQSAAVASQPSVGADALAPMVAVEHPATRPAASPVASNPSPPPANAAIAAPAISQSELPPGSPPLALDGYCPVTLIEQAGWQAGDVRWGAVHRGRTYVFAGPEEQRRFLDDPDRFSPVLAGNDPVLAIDQQQTIPGRREFGLFVERRVYLFSGPDSLQKFLDDPTRYAAVAAQAMRHDGPASTKNQ